jgi:hypothetical protein
MMHAKESDNVPLHVHELRIYLKVTTDDQKVGLCVSWSLSNGCVDGVQLSMAAAFNADL